MIRVKHLLDDIDAEDGQRIWVEPIGLTRDLREWCRVDFVLSYLGPPVALWQWFGENPGGFNYYRSTYRQFLAHSPFAVALTELSRAAGGLNFTLLHTGDCPDHNTATVLQEFLIQLGSLCP